MIDTRKADRRRLRFETLAEAIAEAEALAAAEVAGGLRGVGNWSLGQAISHVAFWAELPFVGYPPEVRPPWAMRLMMKLVKPLMLSRGMPAGVRIPGVEGGTLGADDAPAGEAATRMRRAFERLDHERPDCENPLFGRMPHCDWRRLNQRHAELHLGFFHTD